jgi:hypothetical protein
VKLCESVHAVADHARRVQNKVVGLKGGRAYTIPQKSAALGRYFASVRSEKGRTVQQTLHYVLYDGRRDDVPKPTKSVCSPVQALAPYLERSGPNARLSAAVLRRHSAS